MQLEVVVVSPFPFVTAPCGIGKDEGADNYAFVTWSGITDGRTVGIGWMSNWAYADKVRT